MNPVRLVIRTYQIGFGDCFLLRVEYDTGENRHALIDFGSTEYTKMPSRRNKTQIAADIKKVTGGKLHMVVATHRHQDHISGFAGKSGETIAGLKPDLVVQPWTEHPDLDPEATAPVLAAQPPGSRNLVQAVGSMQAFAAHVLDELDALKEISSKSARPTPQSVFAALDFLGQTNIKNEAAVKGLIALAENSAHGEGFYAKFGDRLPLGDVLPGVQVRVLGPPTNEQWPKIRGQRHVDQDEFWHLRRQFWQAHGRMAANDDQSSELFPGADVIKTPPMVARWALPRLQRLRADQLLQIVRALDSALNNTSLILHITVGNKTLLFPGDAQIENWEFVLQEASQDTNAGRVLSDLLANVDMYKVGHHGSLNATPKSLWAQFAKKNTDASAADRMMSLMSTRGGVHGNRSSRTEVPRRTLVKALETHTNHHSTQSQRAKADFAVEFPLDV